MSVRRRRSAHPPMTKVAMPLDKLDVWLQGRTGDHAIQDRDRAAPDLPGASGEEAR